MKSILTNISVFCLVMFSITSAQSQTIISNTVVPPGGSNWVCGLDSVFSHMSGDSAFFQRMTNYNADVQSKSGGGFQPSTAGPYIVPVVFHIIQASTATPLTYARIEWQMAQLNAAFQDQLQLFNGSASGPRATNAQIEFRLACTPMPPTGTNTATITGQAGWSNPAEPGVVRYVTTNSVVTNQVVLSPTTYTPMLQMTHPNPAVFFPFANYLNIWCVDNISLSGNNNSIVIGYGTFPWMGAAIDGIVMRTDCIGSNYYGNNIGMFAQVDKGAVFAHEVGHYLGLFHTFETVVGGNATTAGGTLGCFGLNGPITNSTSTGWTDGDMVYDTPPTNINYDLGTVTTINSCNENNAPYGGAADENDQLENFMCYSDDDKMNTFTQYQSERMWGAFDVVYGPALRNNLNSPANLAATGVQPNSCGNNTSILTGIFTYSVQAATCSSFTLQFTNPTSSSFSATGWTWNFGDGSNGNGANPVHTYTAIGTYTVSCTATNGTANATYTTAVTVNFGVQIIGQSATDVCRGTEQTIFIQFQPGVSSAILTDGTNQYIVTNYMWLAITEVIPWLFTANSSASYSLVPSCGNGVAAFRVIDCCPSILANGDFEAGSTGFTTDLQDYATAPTQAGTSLWGVYDVSLMSPSSTTMFGNLALITSTANQTGKALTVDGFYGPNSVLTTFPPPAGSTFPICNNTTLQPRVWEEVVSGLRPNTNYFYSFKILENVNWNSACGINRLNFQTTISSGGITPLPTQTLSPTVANSPSHMDWVVYTYTFTTPATVTPATNFSVTINQIRNFNSSYYDYCLDNVTLNEMTPGVQAVGTTTICANATNAPLTAVANCNINLANYNLVWSPSIGLSCTSCSNPIATPTTTTVYTLVATSNLNNNPPDPAFITTVTVTVTNCDCSGALPFVYTSGVVPPGNYVLANNLTLAPGTLNLTGVILGIAPNKSITIPNSSYMDIRASHFYSCLDMWDSIVVNPGGRIKCGGNSLIEDAKTAIHISSIPSTTVQILDVNGVVFNTCGTGITVSSFSYTHSQAVYPVLIVNSVFTSRKLWGSGVTGYPTNATWPTVAVLTNTTGAPSPYQGPHAVGWSFTSADLKAPMNFPLQVGGVGIRLMDVGPALSATPGTYINNEIQIGTAVAINGTQAAKLRNVFDNLHYGIAARSSNFLCINNTFQNMIGVGFKNPSAFGYGIFANADQFHSARVLTPSSLQNKFYECRRSVDLTNYSEAYIKDCYFISNRITPPFNQFTPTSTGILAISWKANPSVTVEIDANYIYNHQAGIGLIQDRILFQNGNQTQIQGPISVTNNWLQANLGNGNPTTQSLGTGIACNNLLTCTTPGPQCLITTTGNITITNNVVNRGFRGIQANNWFLQRVTIKDNSIGMLQEPNGFFGAATEQWGIYSANCKNGVINNNSVGGSALTKDPFWKGIFVTMCTNTEVRCNGVTTLPRGIVFDNLNPGTIFWDNAMNKCLYGYVLQNGGVIGAQSPGGTKSGTDNTWALYTAGGTFKTLADNSDARQSLLDIRNNPVLYHPAGAFNLQLNGVNYNAPGALNFVSPSGGRQCVSNPQQQVIQPGPPDKRVIMENVVQDQMPYIVYPTESGTYNKREVFRDIQQDNSLLNGSPVLLNFYNASLNSNHGKFSLTETYLASENVSAAQTMLNNITTSDAVEHRTKQFYALYATAKIFGGLGTADSVSLDSLARLCPAQYGAMVHQARVLYDLVYDDFHLFTDSCAGTVSNGRLQQNGFNAPVSISEYVVFPNPSSGEFEMITANGYDHVTITVEDVNGKIIYTNKVNFENKQIKLTLDLENGVYMISIDNGESREIHKLIIAK